MRYLEICAGIGGFSRGFEMAGVGWTPAAFCEIEDFPRRILQLRWPGVPVAGDIHTLKYLNGSLWDEQTKIYTGPIDLVAGGLPCQPWSVAGKRRGFADDRDLWPVARRLLSEIQPRWVLFENSSNFPKMAFDRVSIEMEALDYEARAVDLPAGGVEAPYKRQRCFILAHLKSQRRPVRSGAHQNAGARR